MGNPIAHFLSMPDSERDLVVELTDRIRNGLGRDVKIYLTWTPDLRFEWKYLSGETQVGCYVRWRERRHPPASQRLVIYYCSKKVAGLKHRKLLPLEKEYSSFFSRVGHYLILESQSDALVAGSIVETLHGLTSQKRPSR